MMQVRFLNADGTLVEAVIDGVAYSVPLDSDSEIANLVNAWIAEGNTPLPYEPTPVAPPGPPVLAAALFGVSVSQAMALLEGAIATIEAGYNIAAITYVDIGQYFIIFINEIAGDYVVLPHGGEHETTLHVVDKQSSYLFIQSLRGGVPADSSEPFNLQIYSLT